MVLKVNDEPKSISLSELKQGDLLLYKRKAIPEFKFPLTKENASENFSILVNRIIIFSENSPTLCTHAALVYTTSSGENEATAVEAALPYVHVRTKIIDDTHTIEVHRVKDGTDGGKVLEYLPPLEEITKDDVPYALFQAAFAALSCIFRTYGMYNTKKRTAQLVLLQLLLLPLCTELNKLLPFAKNKSRPWFCSQIAAYCYNKAANETGNDAYRIDAPKLSAVNGTAPNDTLFAWLNNGSTKISINGTPTLPDSNAAAVLYNSPSVPDSLKTVIPQAVFDSPELIASGINFFERFKKDVTANALPTDAKKQTKSLKTVQKSALYKAVHKTAKRAASNKPDEKTYISSLCRSFLHKLFLLTEEDATAQKFSDFLIRLQSTFVMPSDLEDSLAQIFALEE